MRGSHWVIESGDSRLIRISDVGVTLGAVKPALFNSQDHAQKTCDSLLGILAGHGVGSLGLKVKMWEGE